MREVVAVVNGQSVEVPEGSSIADLLASRKVSGAVAVEKNRQIVPRSAHATTPVLEGDVLEIVQLVGGG